MPSDTVPQGQAMVCCECGSFVVRLCGVIVYSKPLTELIIKV
jgi:hypothetical protein